MILHIGAYSSKHIMFPYISFINGHFNPKDHSFILCSKTPQILQEDNCVTWDVFSQQEDFLKAMNKADKIILHGIWYDELCELFFQNKAFLKKTFWVLWGGEFHFQEKVSEKRKWLFQNIPYLITGSRDDYLSVKKNYHVQGRHLPCTIFYPNNLYYELPFSPRSHKHKNVLIGNSADPTNNHLEILQKLKPFSAKNIQIFLPLIYGDMEYAKIVEQEAKNIFGDKVLILKNYMEFDAYVHFLSNIDIAIFNHKVQQATGNIIVLLGFGAKVYIHKNSNLKNYFKQFSVKLYDNEDISLNCLQNKIKISNQANMKRYFSKEVLTQTLQEIFSLRISNE
jgi:dTDP-N-acetylfucosamine:lipid II N-acetylfucosaminyltransferase